MKKIILIILSLFIVSVGYCSNESFVIKELDLELIKCPAGSFMMGSPNDEAYRNDDEKSHLVTFTKPFFIGKYEVTQSQYEAVMCKNLSKFKGANKPVEMVSWEDANLFCNKMNLKYLNILPEGYKFALPTEAQWEYACRAGTYTALNSGKNLTTKNGWCSNLDEVAWYYNNSKETTHEVGLKKPNAWGIYDMHGNVYEWCYDWYGEYHSEAVVDPIKTTIETTIGTRRVLRGGSWESLAKVCRSAYRDHCDPSDYNIREYFGFRVVLAPVVYDSNESSLYKDSDNNQKFITDSDEIKILTEAFKIFGVDNNKFAVKKLPNQFSDMAKIINSAQEKDFSNPNKMLLEIFTNELKTTNNISAFYKEIEPIENKIKNFKYYTLLANKDNCKVFGFTMFTGVDISKNELDDNIIELLLMLKEYNFEITNIRSGGFENKSKRIDFQRDNELLKYAVLTFSSNETTIGYYINVALSNREID